METMKQLLQPIKVGCYEIRNRCVMAALTRMRADYETGVPSDLHVKYYSERAENAGFVLTECTSINTRGNSFKGGCGIWSNEQVEGWKKVCDEVHRVDGRIFLQIWHGGRSTLRLANWDQKPIGPSPVRNRHPGRTNKDFVDYEEPEEMTLDIIEEVKKDFRKGAENAKLAGFDGLELHGANGYLIDNFLRDGSNQRTDEYGGSAEGRCKFPLEIIDILIDVFGNDKIGIKLTPVGRLNDGFDSDPISTYSYFLKELDRRKIAFVEIAKAPEYRPVPNYYGIKGEDQIPDVYETFRPYFSGILIANNGFDFETGNKLLEERKADMISFGRPFISNPDLVHRFRNGWELSPWNDKLFYVAGPEGYIDYPTYEDYIKQKENN
jgi:N-ethylmaleimide reductase